MPSKKKSKPSFEVPQDLQTAPQAGWVYRSDGDASGDGQKPETGAAPMPTPAPQASLEGGALPAPATAEAVEAAPKPKTGSRTGHKAGAKTSSKTGSKSDSKSGILDLAAKTISAGFETVGNAVLLTTRIMMMPLDMGMRVLRLK